MNKGEKEEHLP